ncbi:MAG: hypothetical protein KAS71_05100 [Bacteroidales bacterium]|nr:hypothetical protein [Bacteroidales bacterium]
MKGELPPEQALFMASSKPELLILIFIYQHNLSIMFIAVNIYLASILFKKLPALTEVLD